MAFLMTWLLFETFRPVVVYVVFLGVARGAPKGRDREVEVKHLYICIRRRG
jgi:hypothetical protein